MIAMGVILMMSFFMFVWTRICVLNTGYQISEAIKRRKAICRKTETKIERASLTAPSRIENMTKINSA